MGYKGLEPFQHTIRDKAGNVNKCYEYDNISHGAIFPMTICKEYDIV